MKSVVRALPDFAELVDEVEVWSVTCEVEHPKLRWDPLWWAPRPWPLRLVWCVLAFHLRAFWRFVILRQPRPELIQCTDFYALFADLIYVHFHFGRYQEIIRSKPGLIQLSFPRRVMVWFCRCFESACFRWASPKLWLTVSESMAGHLADREELCNVKILPNAYDPVRFSAENRRLYRDETRSRFGIMEDELVLGFSAMGDFERKGLPLLLAAADRLVRDGCRIRVLIVGGASADGLSAAELAPAGLPPETILCTGRVTDTERYFAAMDAFVFPSHCESFCLVLLEAAAMGVRIYPAAFDGHEMTLVEGVNGALIPWDADAIALRIKADFATGKPVVEPPVVGKALSDQDFSKALCEIHRRLHEAPIDSRA